MSCDILNLEWASSGRDIDVVEPILSYLEIRHNLNIVRESIIHYPQKILKYKPRMIVISNAYGAVRNYNMVRFAKKLGIKVVTLISEGDYVGDERTKEFFWGCNKHEILYETLHLEWSYRNLELIKRNIENAESFNIKISGATGFDRYKILPFLSKEACLEKYDKRRYQKVVGIAAWAFDLILGDYYQRVKETYETGMGIESINTHRDAKELLRDIYIKLIKENEDVLFILKHHPGCLQEELTELYELDRFQNVVVVRGQMENIADLISACDLWVAYESTTCLEAWLLGKKTMLINPAGSHFKRSEIAKGSPVSLSYEAAKSSIDDFFQTGSLSGFDELAVERGQIIRSIIQWDDGKNHIRAGEYIYEELNLPNGIKIEIDLWTLKEVLKGYSSYVVEALGIDKLYPTSERFASIRHFNRIYNMKERARVEATYKKYLNLFYTANTINYGN